MQDEKIYVELSNAKLATLGIDPALIASTLASTNTCDAAGTVQTASEQVRLTVSGEFDSVESIRNIGIRAGDRMFRLGDIAEVQRGCVEPATSKMRFKGEPAIGLAVSMRKGGDVIRLGEQLDARSRASRRACRWAWRSSGLRPAARGRGVGARVQEEPARGGRDRAAW